MSTRTLFLAWQDKKPSKAWFPVGRLDADVERSFYRFRYIGGAKRAQEEVGFPLLIEFPDLNEDYQAAELFPLFQNRVMNRARPDFTDYLHRLDLTEEADPIEILSTNGGHRVTDAYEVFPKIEKDDTGSFSCRFFLHGWRHINEATKDRIDRLAHGEELYVTLELTNPATGLAVQMQTTDYYMIGWAPRYLVADLVAAMAEGPSKFGAKVVRINPQTVLLKQRVLIEMYGCWDQYEPMSSEDFKPLVP
ncbi:MAG: DNA-binding protein [Gemmatimonadetes bacterium]|nr:DNA-binding protein [Gemmatimonadota bacterium]